MDDWILQTNRLSKRFNGFYANKDVSLQICKGDIYGFIGVNGAGKTTFMKMICGLSNPTEGSFSLMGETEPKKINEVRRKMGVLIEHPALIDDMSALQNMIVQGRYKGISKKDGMNEYISILEKVGLSDAKDKLVKGYSMGMKQRLGLALCLIGGPEFVVLDEPYVSLDPVGVNDFRRILQEINKAGVTILFSCHTLSEVTRIATRFGFIHKGQIRLELTAEELNKSLKEEGSDLEAFFIKNIEKWDGQ